MNDEIPHTRGRFPYGRRLERTGPYLAAAFLSLAILFWVFDLWKADLRVLFTYYIGGDLFSTATLIKGFIDNGSYLVNPNLGAPFGLQFYDYPMSEALHFLLLRLVNIFTGNYAATINLFYVLSFPLTALSALWVFRRFDIGAIPAVICSLLYAFLAAHFGRGMHHLALACYFLVPLLIWVVLTIGIPGSGQPSGGWKGMLKSRWFLGRLAVCVAIGSYGFYYSFFGMFFLACGGLFAWAVHKYRMGFLTSLVLVGAMLLTSLCNVLPNIVFWARQGTNQAAVVRAPIAAEIYALKITHLLLPILGHKLSFLAQLRGSYQEQGSGTEASTTGGFGLIGAVGFILLLACSLFRNRDTSRDYVFELLGSLNLMGVLLSTVGGFGSIVSLLGLTQIRAYNRIGVFLAFLAFMAVALVWRKVEKSIPAGSRPVFIIVSLLVAVFGLWDEIPGGVAPNYALSSAQWTQDASYVAMLESSTPPGSMIFQLPYMPFPESGQLVEMTDYSHFRPYLHSKNLRWSYGTIKGRKGAAWMESTSALPVPQMVKAVVGAGYAGIYIDRFGYADSGTAIEGDLRKSLSIQPIESADGRELFFSLVNYAGRGTTTAGPLISRQIAAELNRLTAYKWGERLLFDPAHAARLGLFLREGWCPQEVPEFRWTTGRQATLEFSIEPTHRDKILWIIVVQGIMPYKRFPVIVTVDGTRVGEWKAVGGEMFSMKIPGAVLTGKDRFTLAFDMPDATTPRALGLSTDPRVLGLAMREIRIEESPQ